MVYNLLHLWFGFSLHLWWILHLWLTFITFMVSVTVIQQLLNEAELNVKNNAD